MSVYFFKIFIENTLVNFFLLLSTLTFFKNKKETVYLIILSIISAIFLTIITILFGKIINIIKPLNYLLLVLYSIKYDGVKNYLNIVVIFLVLNLNFLSIKKGIENILIINELILEIIILSIIFLVVKFVQKIKVKRLRINKFIYDIEIFIDKKVFMVKGFLDTGNQVYDGDFPVIIADKYLSKKLLNGRVLDSTGILKLTTISGQACIKTIKKAKIKVKISSDNYKEKLVTIGLTDKILKSQLILHPEVI